MTHAGAAIAALQVFQQAVKILAEWAEFKLPPECTCQSEYPVVSRVKGDILPWRSGDKPQPLRLLFDRVNLIRDRDPSQDKVHYWQAGAIADRNPTIPYPQTSPPAPQELTALKQEIQQALKSITAADWQNLSLLTLILEKCGSYVSFGESDIALVDVARTTAAVAAAITDNPELSLVAGDLSGIQKFIYTISSDGALKSLRARSFYLELVTEEVVCQLLSDLNLPRTNVIYAGGGKLYILAAARDETKQAVIQVRQQVNKWLLHKFQGKVFLALDCLTFPIEDVANKKFADYWSKVTGQLGLQKSQKFVEQITEFIEVRDRHEHCRVCHRDDVTILQQLNHRESDSVLACDTCRQMFLLGSWLFEVKAIVRSLRDRTAQSYQQDIEGNPHTISFQFPATAQRPATNIYYHLFSTWKPSVSDSDTVFLVNDWTVEHYQFRHFRQPVPLLLANYGRESQQKSENPKEPAGFMRASEMAEVAKGIKRVGYLRMDVDSLGQIFANGLGENKTLPRLAGLSRQMSYFFKVYLNSLARARQDNLPKTDKKIKCLTQSDRLNLLFIYAGGDDLFVSGAWNEVVEFGFDVYQCFRAYTGWNPDITLSAGIGIADVKFPLYQAAKVSGDAEDAAKSNGKDSLGLFGEKFKWSEWLGVQDIIIIDKEVRDYLKLETLPELWGVFPFVERLNNQWEINYSRSFVRNLLLTAQIQEQSIEKMKDSPEEQEQMAIRYYLHLPKIAYTLARLPRSVREHKDFVPVRTSLKNPYNAPYFRAIATWIEFLNRS